MILTPKQASGFLNRALQEKLGIFTRQTFLAVDPGAEYSHNWHVDCIAEYLTACTKRDIKRLIINIPPRYMKSISVTVAWPAWLIGNNPSAKIMAASYSQVLATKHSLDCRHVINSEWYRRAFPAVELAADENQKTRFQTTQKGHRIATSVTGTAIGEGGDFLIVDDPHNPASALSETKRVTALNWFDQSFATRLNNKKEGVIVVVMQRLHQNDLTGHLLEKGGWEHLCIPAECEKKTFYQIGNFKKNYEEGEILHPERENKEQLNAVKRELGSYAYAGQYQQRPAPAGGGIFKKEDFKYFRTHRRYKRIVQSWDTAYKAAQHNDPSVCTTWGEHEFGYDLLDVKRGRFPYPKLKKLAIEHAEYWSSKRELFAGHILFTILIEDKASGQSLIQDMRNETTFNIEAISPEGDKLTRAHVVTPQFEAGKVFFLEGAPWLEDYEAELLAFDNGIHDDQVDSTSQFLISIATPLSGSITDDMLEEEHISNNNLW